MTPTELLAYVDWKAAEALWLLRFREAVDGEDWDRAVEALQNAWIMERVRKLGLL